MLETCILYMGCFFRGITMMNIASHNHLTTVSAPYELNLITTEAN